MERDLKNSKNCCLCNHNETVVLYKVPICQSCRKIFYEEWRAFLTDNYHILVNPETTQDQMMRLVVRYVNDANKCLGLVDFSDYSQFCRILHDEEIEKMNKLDRQKLENEQIQKRQRILEQQNRIFNGHCDYETQPGTSSSSALDASSDLLNNSKYNFACRICKFRKMILIFKVVPKVKLKIKDIKKIQEQNNLNQLNIQHDTSQNNINSNIIQFGINHTSQLDRFYIFSTEIMKNMVSWCRNVENKGKFVSKYSGFTSRKEPVTNDITHLLADKDINPLNYEVYQQKQQKQIQAEQKILNMTSSNTSSIARDQTSKSSNPQKLNQIPIHNNYLTNENNRVISNIDTSPASSSNLNNYKISHPPQGKIQIPAPRISQNQAQIHAPTSSQNHTQTLLYNQYPHIQHHTTTHSHTASSQISQPYNNSSMSHQSHNNELYH